LTDARTDSDRILAAYAILSGLALFFPYRPSFWPVLVLAHAALVALALNAGRWRAAAPGPSDRPVGAAPSGALPGRGGHRIAAVLADWYPLIVIPLLYVELDLLNVSVWGGRYFDSVILGWEQAVFGLQPSLTFAAAAPYLLLSELLHASYLSYYAIIYVPPLVLYLRGDREAFLALLRPLVAGFLLHYLIFVYFPVQGPRFLFPSPGGAIAEGPLYQLTHFILETGSSAGAAFPSSHMAVATIQTIAAFRFLPRAAPIMLVATIGIGLGATYGGYHYAIDMILGAVGGLLIGFAFLAFDRRYTER